MPLSMVGQLAHPADDGGRRASRHRDIILTNGHGLPGREQSDNGEVREWGWGRGRRPEIARISVKAFAVAPRWIVYGVNLFVVTIAVTSTSRDFEIIPATSSLVCCGDDVATFHVATRALYIYIYIYIYIIVHLTILKSYRNRDFWSESFRIGIAIFWDVQLTIFLFAVIYLISSKQC